VLYLTGSLPARPDLFRALQDCPHAGVLLTPRNSYPSKPLDTWPRAADNGCFAKDWDEHEWRDWIGTVDPTVLFAVVPDVVGDCHATRIRWDRYADELTGFRRAYVLQDGQQASLVPWDETDAVFIGGSTRYKLSPDARRLTTEARERGLWVHMGRVNSLTRMRLAHQWGCDSVDGNYIAFGPDINTPRVLAWLRDIHNREAQMSLEMMS
jgi:hypothetical protein